MRVLDLFSGIGGFSLGLKRAGMRTVAFCEIDSYCRRVLAKHWPGVPIFGDICELTGADIMADAAEHRRQIRGTGDENGNPSAARVSNESSRSDANGFAIDLICGGFPCQDISVAGKGAGLAGARSGLWSEFARLIREIRPRYVIVENVSALLGRGLERVLGDLAEIGYDAEWHCIPASAVGAPHRRDRVWIVAYTNDGERSRFGQHSGPILPEQKRVTESWCECGQWKFEPDVGRVANGVPARVDRLRALGNSVVPQITEIIGRAIMALDTAPGAKEGGK